MSSWWLGLEETKYLGNLGKEDINSNDLLAKISLSVEDQPDYS